MQENKKLQPKDFNILYDNVLIECSVVDDVIDEETGLINPQGYEDKPEIGTVIRVGTGRILNDGTIKPLILEEGDVVYFNKYSATKMRLDTVDYYILREEDIVAYYRE